MVQTQDLERSLTSTPAMQGTPGLLVIDSPDEALRGRFVPLDGELIVGREVGFSIADGRISREQAALRWRADATGCEVRDLGSRNGTFVDGRRVTSEVAPVGSVVRAGDTFFEITPQPPAAPPHALMVGRSAPLLRLLQEIHRFAASDVSLLIEGETGTGKELVAEAVHQLSGRGGKLVAVNCASIPPAIAESFLFGHKKGAFTGASHDAEGIFEQAGDGTLFLDEIGELRLDLQAKLLRVLETRQLTPVGAAAPRTTNARFLSATNARLRLAVAAGTFRSDLFARLAGVELEVPPLRARRCDIPLLAAHFFPGVRFSANALEVLLLHAWPMNVRELRTVCGRLSLLHPDGGLLRSADVAPALQKGDAPAPAEEPPANAPSRAELAELLRVHKGNVVRVAAHYDKDRRQIYRWLELYGLDARDFR